MENMLDLLKEPVEVIDSPNTRPLIATKGKIEFRNVSFNYSPERPILKDISFVVEPGETLAIVSIVEPDDLGHSLFHFSCCNPWLAQSTQNYRNDAKTNFRVE